MCKQSLNKSSESERERERESESETFLDLLSVASAAATFLDLLSVGRRKEGEDMLRPCCPRVASVTNAASRASCLLASVLSRLDGVDFPSPLFAVTSSGRLWC